MWDKWTDTRWTRNLETEVVNPAFEQWVTAARKQSVKVKRVKEWKVRVDWDGYVWEHMEGVENQSDDQLGFDDVIHDCCSIQLQSNKSMFILQS